MGIVVQSGEARERSRRLVLAALAQAGVGASATRAACRSFALLADCWRPNGLPGSPWRKSGSDRRSRKCHCSCDIGATAGMFSGCPVLLATIIVRRI